MKSLRRRCRRSAALRRTCRMSHEPAITAMRARICLFLWGTQHFRTQCYGRCEPFRQRAPFPRVRGAFSGSFRPATFPIPFGQAAIPCWPRSDIQPLNRCRLRPDCGIYSAYGRHKAKWQMPKNSRLPYQARARMKTLRDARRPAMRYTESIVDAAAFADHPLSVNFVGWQPWPGIRRALELATKARTRFEEKDSRRGTQVAARAPKRPKARSNHVADWPPVLGKAGQGGRLSDRRGGAFRGSFGYPGR